MRSGELSRNLEQSPMISPDSASEANLSQTVLKALDVIECLASTKRPMSAPEVAKQCQMSRPTVYRLLSTLQSRGYVTNVEHEYTLGTKFLSLSRGLLVCFTPDGGGWFVRL